MINEKFAWGLSRFKNEREKGIFKRFYEYFWHVAAFLGI